MNWRRDEAPEKPFSTYKFSINKGEKTTNTSIQFRIIRFEESL
jgi:hypothetical protein